MTLIELYHLIRKHWQPVVTLPVGFAVIMALVAFLFMPNKYTASVSMYVLTRSSSDAIDSLSSSDLTASQMLTNDVSALIKSSRVVDDTATTLGMEDLDAYSIGVTSSTTTRIITLNVTGRSPEQVALVANQLADTTDEVAREIMDVQSVNVIDKATAPTLPSGPPRLLYTLVAAMAGLFLAVAAVVILDMLDTRIHKPDDIEALIGVPVIGRIPTVRS